MRGELLVAAGWEGEQLLRIRRGGHALWCRTVNGPGMLSAHPSRHERAFQEDVGSHPRTSLRSASGGREPSSRSIGQVSVASQFS